MGLCFLVTLLLNKIITNMGLFMLLSMLIINFEPIKIEKGGDKMSFSVFFIN